MGQRCVCVCVCVDNRVCCVDSKVCEWLLEGHCCWRRDVSTSP